MPRSSTDPTRSPVLLLASALLALVLLAAAPATGAAEPTGVGAVYGASLLTDECSTAPRPAATLLMPYVEVDLEGGGRTTLLAVTNQNAVGQVLARVVLWSDLGIPVLSFDLFLRPRMTQTLNLRDVLNGVLPSAGSVAELAPFAGCGAHPTFGPSRTLSPAVRQRVRAWLVGEPAPGTNLCASYPYDTFGYGERLARGYVTVDLVDQCSPISTSRAYTPASPSVLVPYFVEGGGEVGIARPFNWLTGDYLLVDPDDNFAFGAEAVHVVADPDRFPTGTDLQTFYGLYVGFSGRDGRAPLPGVWRSRYLNGGPFTGGTDLLVWHRQRLNETEAFDCTLDPYHFPLGYTRLTAVREDGTGFTTLSPEPPVYFPIGRVTQRVPVEVLGTLPGAFGVVELDLDLTEIPIGGGAARPNQAWVVPVLQASGRFSVGLNAHPIDTRCPLKN